MSRRTQVRGPTSALTEFLASQGISASAMRKRGAQAREDDQPPASDPASTPAPLPAIQSKARPKIRAGASLQFDEDDDDLPSPSPLETPIAPPPAKRAAVPESVPLRPGEPVSCAICGVQFSITRYTRVEPGIGALCWKCNKTVPKQPRVKAAPRSRVSTSKSASSIGAVIDGAIELPTLQHICIQIVAEHIHQVKALDQLRESSMHNLSRVISKNRSLTPATLPLFLSPTIRELRLFDCSALDPTSLQSIPIFAPNIEVLQLQYCGQLNNDAFASLATLPHLRVLDLYGPFLVFREAWLRFFPQCGAQLTHLRLRETPRFDHSCMQAMVTHCPRLQEVALAQIGPLDDEGVHLLSSLGHLTHLDVSQPGVSQPGIPPASLTDQGMVPLLNARGSQLESLHLSKNHELGDATISALKTCSRLETLMVDMLEHVTTSVWASTLAALPALRHISLACCALEDDALIPLLQTARHLTTLRINGNDALTPRVFEVLATEAPPLEELDLGFVRCVDDQILSTLIQAMPTLRKVYVFGCFQVAHFTSQRVTIVGRERR